MSCGQIARDVTRTVVAEQSWPVDDMNLVTAGCLQCEIQRICYVLGPHVGAQLPRDDITAVIVQNRAEIEPAPSQYLDVGEVGLPKLIDRSRFVFELIGCFDDDECRAGD